MIPSMQEPERLQPALRAELKSGVQALRFMAEIELRKLYVERGFSSLFRFCRRRGSSSGDPPRTAWALTCSWTG